MFLHVTNVLSHQSGTFTPDTVVHSRQSGASLFTHAPSLSLTCSTLQPTTALDQLCFNGALVLDRYTDASDVKSNPSYEAEAEGGYMDVDEAVGDDQDF